MNQKLIVPVAFVVLAVGAVVAIFFLLQSDPPGTRGTGNTAASNESREKGQPLSMDDFELARVEPDPVRTERPPQPYTAPKQTSRMIVAGRVVDDAGVPVADARVYFTGAGKLHAMTGVGYTDATGAYRLLAWAGSIGTAGEPQGKVAAESPDGRLVVGEIQPITQEAQVDMPDLAFGPACTLEGQVVAAGGEPAAGAEVTVHSAGPVPVASLHGREHISSRRSLALTVTADQDGRFVFRNLPPARYVVNAQAGYFGVSGPAPETDLTAGTRAWQDVRLDNQAFVRGVVRDGTGSPLSGVVVRVVSTADPTVTTAPAIEEDTLQPVRDLRRPESGFRGDGTAVAGIIGERRAVTDSAGRFGFSHLIDADYRLEIKLGEGEARLEGVKINQPDYELVVPVAFSVGGVVRDAETGRPVEFYDVRSAGPAGEGAASPFDRVSEDGRFEYHPAGAFVIVNPAPEGGKVRVSAPGYLPAIVELGELREGDARRDLDVSLKPLCEVTIDLTQEGRRLDFEPVALLFDDRLAFEASSDQLGRVRIPHVAPTKYRVKVTLADGTHLETEIEVPAERQATVEAKLKPAG